MKFRLKGWDGGTLYFYFCIVWVKNYSVVHFLLFALFVPVPVFCASARTESLHCRGSDWGWG